MARPRTSTNILALRGTYKHNPAVLRAREGEPVPDGPIGDPPDALADDEKQAWVEVVAECPLGVMGDADRKHLEVVAKLVALSRRVPVEDMGPGLLGKLMSGLGLLGMNPSDRSRIKVPPKAAVNEFEDL